MPAAVLRFDANRPRRESGERRARAPGRPRSGRKASTRPLRNIVVLVVEDHEDTRTMLGRMLESLGATVLLAPDAPAAQVVLGMERPHVILLDLMLPGMDGLT